MTDVYQIISPVEILLPIVLSIPHAGIHFPEELADDYKPEILPPDDTDWFVDQLYQFGTALGIPIIKAQYSRWVIDLNRNPDSQPLYTDGRLITGLCPATDFLGTSIYKEGREAISNEEVARRKELYFEPYHQQVQTLLNEIKAQFGKVLLWDCHSIRRQVPTISATPFPDMILGSVDETSAGKNIIDTALHSLYSANHQVKHNHPFKGGFITRHFGKPSLNQHALQLEMCKDLYMDDSETNYDESRAATMQELLKQTLLQVAASL